MPRIKSASDLTPLDPRKFCLLLIINCFFRHWRQEVIGNVISARKWYLLRPSKL